MAPKYKLTYFNIAGSGEHIRYIFAYANEEFEDNRIKMRSWPELKPKTPFGKIPILEFDGKVINQSNAIARYLAKKFGLTGKDEWEELLIDALVDSFGDFKALMFRKFYQNDEATLAEIKKDEDFYLGKFDKILSDSPSGYLVGSQVTWVDLVLASNLLEMQKRNPDFLKPFPALAKHTEQINSIPSIKTYLEKKPKSDPPPHGPPPKK